MDLKFERLGKPDGVPVPYCHGSPSSRLEAHLIAKQAEQHGIQLISFDRRGFGLSPFNNKQTVLDEACDVVALADHLGFDRFAVIGISGGGTTVLATAYLAPERLTYAASVGGWTPVADLPELQSELAPLDRFFLRIAGLTPALFTLPFAYLGHRIRKSRESLLKMLKGSLGEADKALLEKDEQFADFFVEDVREAFRQGAKGPARDAWLRYRPWGFSLTDIKCPVRFLAGDDDKFAPLAMTKAAVDAVPDAKLDIIEGTGHLGLFQHFDIVFSEAAKASA